MPTLCCAVEYSCVILRNGQLGMQTAAHLIHTVHCKQHADAMHVACNWYESMRMHLLKQAWYIRINSFTGINICAHLRQMRS
jgi:hypothetical protein